MATINVDLGQGTLVANKGEDIRLSYTISPPIASEDDVKLYTENSTITNNPNVPQEVKFSHLKDEWFVIKEFSIDEEENLNILGAKTPSFKYKIDFTTVDGVVIQELQPYQEDFMRIDEDYSSEVVIPITLLTSATTTYKIQFTVLFQTEQTYTTTRDVILYNDNPAIVVTVKRNVVYISISDEDNDLVRYNVYLNGGKIFPEDSDFTDWQQPTATSIQLDSSQIKVGEVNRVVVNVEDEWGGRTSTEHLFVGQYFGVLFADEKGQYYSDEFGEIIKMLNFGTVIAGKVSNIQVVRIYNKTEEIINKITLNSDSEIKPNKLTIYYGWDETSMQTDDSNLVYTKELNDEDYINLYLQIKPDLEYEEKESIFDILLEAETKEE